MTKTTVRELVKAIESESEKNFIFTLENVQAAQNKYDEFCEVKVTEYTFMVVYTRNDIRRKSSEMLRFCTSAEEFIKYEFGLGLDDEIIASNFVKDIDARVSKCAACILEEPCSVRKSTKPAAKKSTIGNTRRKKLYSLAKHVK